MEKSENEFLSYLRGKDPLEAFDLHDLHKKNCCSNCVLCSFLREKKLEDTKVKQMSCFLSCSKWTSFFFLSFSLACFCAWCIPGLIMCCIIPPRIEKIFFCTYPYPMLFNSDLFLCPPFLLCFMAVSLSFSPFVWALVYVSNGDHKPWY